MINDAESIQNAIDTRRKLDIKFKGDYKNHIVEIIYQKRGPFIYSEELDREYREKET